MQLTPPPLPKKEGRACTSKFAYAVTFGVLAAALSAYLCYRKLTDPAPLSVDDEAGPMFMMLLYLTLGLVVLASGLIGAFAGIVVHYCGTQCTKFFVTKTLCFVVAGLTLCPTRLESRPVDSGPPIIDLRLVVRRDGTIDEAELKRVEAALRQMASVLSNASVQIEGPSRTPFDIVVRLFRACTDLGIRIEAIKLQEHDAPGSKSG